MKRKLAVQLGLILGILLLNSLSAAEEGRAAVIRNVRVFDGEKMMPAAEVLILDGLIAAVGDNLQVPDGAFDVDGTDHTLLPGLIDAHVHVYDMGKLRQALYFGVTTVIDMFMEVKTMQRLKKEQVEKKEGDRPYLISPGILATAPGGHGTQYGMPIPTVSHPGDAEPFVQDRIADGSDFLKIIYDDGSAYGLNRPTLDKDTLAALIRAAHARDMKVVIHAATLENCKTVFALGGDGLAHLFFNDAFDPDFGRLAKQAGVFVIPTLSVLETMSGRHGGELLIQDSLLQPWLKPDDLINLKMDFGFTSAGKAFAAAETALRQLREAGVPILAGTDAPNPGTTFGASLHRELELLVKAGLSPLEALRSATSVSADIFGLADRGRIRPGAAADLILVKGDPSQNILATRDLALIWKRGTLIDRSAYQKEIDKARAEEEKLKAAPPPEYSNSGWISDFEGDKISARFGAGWMASTDAMMGGKSSAQYRLVEGGAEGSAQSLLITGEVKQGGSAIWAGAMFSPGKMPMSPANLSFKSGLTFWAKGIKGTYSVMLFSRSLGFTPSFQTFEAGPEWKEVSFSFESFGVEGYDIMGIFIGLANRTGKFNLQIDNLRLK